MSNQDIAVVILAAGQSKRMGAPKLLLPWGGTTVLGQVLKVCARQADSGTDFRSNKRIMDVVVVTGGWRAEVEAEVKKLAKHYQVRTVFNPEYERGEMLSSIQVGLRALTPSPLSLRERGVLIALGDQPQVQSRTVRDVLRAFDNDDGHIVVPSYRMRRGHPILVPRQYWDEILQMQSPQTLRDFLNAHANNINYVEADESVLQDLDTPEDYKRAQGA